MLLFASCVEICTTEPGIFCIVAHLLVEVWHFVPFLVAASDRPPQTVIIRSLGGIPASIGLVQQYIGWKQITA